MRHFLDIPFLCEAIPSGPLPKNPPHEACASSTKRSEARTQEEGGLGEESCLKRKGWRGGKGRKKDAQKVVRNGGKSIFSTSLVLSFIQKKVRQAQTSLGGTTSLSGLPNAIGAI